MLLLFLTYASVLQPLFMGITLNNQNYKWNILVHFYIKKEETLQWNCMLAVATNSFDSKRNLNSKTKPSRWFGKRHLLILTTTKSFNQSGNYHWGNRRGVKKKQLSNQSIKSISLSQQMYVSIENFIIQYVTVMLLIFKLIQIFNTEIIRLSRIVLYF